MTINHKHLMLLMVLAMLGWGGSWPIAKFLSAYITEHEIVTYRYALTTLSMLPMLIFMRLSIKINIKSLLLIVIVGVLLIFYTKLFFLGTKFGTAGLAGALVTTLMPIIVFVLMLFSHQTKPNLKDWLALILGVIGVLTMMNIWSFQLNEVLNTSNVYLLWAALCWALMSIVSSYAKSVHPVVASFYIYLVATVVDYFVFFEPNSGSILSMGHLFWVNFLILVFVSTTFATSMYFYGVQNLGSNKASVFTFLVPFFAIGLSIIFLDETLKLTTIVGVIMTIIALSILNNVKWKK